MEYGYNKDINYQIKLLKKILFKNKKLKYLLEVMYNSGLDNYYVGAGCVNQTVFNYYHGFDLDYGISDYDVVYYDSDLSYEKEDFVIKKITGMVNCDIKLDIKNQARVYLWYYEKYGIKRKPYVSVEDAIGRWGSTVTCIGVRLNNGKFEVFAPYGLNDLFGMIIRPVKIDFSKFDYDKKCIKWKSKWNKLKIISWEGKLYEDINNGC